MERAITPRIGRPSVGATCHAWMLLASLALLPACATRVAIPRASLAEEAVVERELRSVLPSDVLDRANHRFWDVFIDDPSVLSALTAEQRSALREGGPDVRESAIGELHAMSVREWSVDAVRVTQTSPSLIREIARGRPAEARDLFEAADAVEQLQRPLRDRVGRVAGRVFEAAGRGDLALTVDAQVGLNAFAPVTFDTRQIFVGPELALHAQSDGELACVIGHEVAHVTEGHTAAGAWANLGKQALTAMIAAAALGAIAYANEGAPLTRYDLEGAIAAGQLTTLLLTDVPLRLAGWQRGQEREADAMGLVFAARAGYDPDDCARLMLHMGQAFTSAGNVDGPRWWTVHPPTPERIVALRKLAGQWKSGTLEVRE